VRPSPHTPHSSFSHLDWNFPVQKPAEILVKVHISCSKAPFPPPLTARSKRSGCPGSSTSFWTRHYHKALNEGAGRRK